MQPPRGGDGGQPVARLADHLQDCSPARPTPADARVKRLTVTAAGRRLAEQAVGVVEAADAAFFARVHDNAQVLDVLHQLAHDPDLL